MTDHLAVQLAESSEPNQLNGSVLTDEPPREVWVVSSPVIGPDFVASYPQIAMEHAADLAENMPENGPYRVCRYIAVPFATGANHG